jgi:hypothetical protein
MAEEDMKERHAGDGCDEAKEAFECDCNEWLRMIPRHNLLLNDL